MRKFLLSFFVTLAVLGLGAAAYFILGGKLPPSAGGGSGSSSGLPAGSSSGPPAEWDDHGIFSAYYGRAYKKLASMTLEEKVGQMILARCPAQNAAADARSYHLGGYLLFERDFKGKTAAQVVSAIGSYQAAASVPMLMAVDEEGGTVVRISGNPLLAAQKFRSPRKVYELGGFAGIRADTLAKAALLKKLGLNVNLAPVSDVSTDPADYIYPRAFGEPAARTGEYVTTVVQAMKEVGLSCTLKHFPGYGNNRNTHTGIAVDSRPRSEFESSDLIPFEDGIRAGAQSVLVAHTIVECMDPGVPASLSPAVHKVLRGELRFTGVIMTDDLSMDAIQDYTHGGDPSVKAVLAGNDLLILTDYRQGYDAVLAAVRAGTVSESTVDRAVFRILAWKYASGLLR